MRIVLSRPRWGERPRASAATKPLRRRRREPARQEPLPTRIAAIFRVTVQNSTDRKLKSGAAQMLLVLAAAQRVSVDEHADERDREAAIATLAHESAALDSDLQRLERLLESPLSSRLQKAVLERIGGTRGEAVAQLLIAEWTRFSPALRNSIIDVLLRREAWTTHLLDALESKAILGQFVVPPFGRH